MTPPCWSAGITISVGSFLAVSFFSALLPSGLSAFPMPLHPESVRVSAPNKTSAFDNFTAGSPFQRQAQDRRDSIESQKVFESIAVALRLLCAVLPGPIRVEFRLPGKQPMRWFWIHQPHPEAGRETSGPARERFGMLHKPPGLQPARDCGSTGAAY